MNFSISVSKEMWVKNSCLIVHAHKSRKRTIQSWIAITQKWAMVFIHNAVKKMHRCNWGHTLRWHHNKRGGFSNHQPYDGLLNRLFRRRSKKTLKLPFTGLCEGNSPVTGEFPLQRPVTRKMFQFDDVIMNLNHETSLVIDCKIDVNFITHIQSCKV